MEIQSLYMMSGHTSDALHLDALADGQGAGPLGWVGLQALVDELGDCGRRLIRHLHVPACDVERSTIGDRCGKAEWWKFPLGDRSCPAALLMRSLMQLSCATVGPPLRHPITTDMHVAR